MTVVEQNIGFRFDIYERIHLPEGTLAIRDLEEIELTPYFQGIPGTDQTQLRGNLQLTAVYDSTLEGAGRQTFIHRIPVEISLPIRTNDVTSQEIKVQIDQFDVELVSDRSLNVTGILSLAGWEQVRSESTDYESDEFYAEHHYEQGSSEQQIVAEQAEVGHHSRVENQVPAQLGASVEPIVQDELIVEDNVQVKVQDTELPDQVKPLHEIGMEKQAEQPEQVEVNEAPKPDMKVAIKPQQVEAILESAVEVPAKPEKANNSLEWKRLFLIREDKVEFKQLRMCIVQKEDTLETIANRYELQPREIALYNRLGEVEVSEGQIIYIPKSNV